MRDYNIAVIGATGAVGAEVIKVLEKRNFPVKNIRFLASSRSAGKNLKFKKENIVVEELKEDSFKDIEIAFFAAGSDTSRQFAKTALDSGTIIIDKSSAFRMDKDVPLIVPEVNKDKIKEHKGIIASPNCATIILVMAIYPLSKLSKIKRLVVSTYQSTSGAGAKAMEELLVQTKAYLNDEKIVKEVFPHQIAFNLFSHNTRIYENGYNDEENKVIEETRKIMGDPDVKISATCIRVPILRSHCESINVEFENKVTVDRIRESIIKSEGVKLVDDRENNYFPMPIDSSEKDEILIGRIREDISRENCVEIFVSGDQLLKGAALNAVQIAEEL
jgi:aspartate-semialdehyde dehydrogenase